MTDLALIEFAITLRWVGGAFAVAWLVRGVLS